MEIDANAVVSRVLMKAAEASNQGPAMTDLSISQALGMAREQFMKSLTTSRDTH